MSEKIEQLLERQNRLLEETNSILKDNAGLLEGIFKALVLDVKSNFAYPSSTNKIEKQYINDKSTELFGT